MPCNFAKQPAYLLRSILVFFFILALVQFASGQTVPDTTIVTTVPTADSLPVKPKPAVVKAKNPVPLKDSIAVKDSMPAPVQTIVTDSVSKKPWFYPGLKMDTAISLSTQVLFQHPYYGFRSKPVAVYTGIKKFEGKEVIFYSLVALLLAFAFLRQAFPKYFSDLFRLLFRTTLKQKQVREQLMQTPLPSLLLNGFFVISAGLYIDILLQHFNLAPVDNFWLLFVYCAAGKRSAKAAEILKEKGFKEVYQLKGGLDAWKAAKLPL